MSVHYLDKLFAPESVAVFGASERRDSVGACIFSGLVRGGFSGTITAINPKHKQVNGWPCVSRIADIAEHVDLAIIATPAATVAEIIHQCGRHGVRAAVVISAGFGEGKGVGNKLLQPMLDAAAHYRLRLLGPNCLGLLRPSIGLNATFSRSTARPGSLALVSQSGALCTAILDWADARDIGFSAVVSLGSAADIGFGDVLDYLAMDPQTESILLYVEGITNARDFMSGLRVAARLKPVVVIKAGRHDEGSRAAVSHTGAIVGSDDVFAAALQRAGAVRAETIEQLFSAAQLLSTRQRVKGDRLAIVTNGGGPGVMATDRAVDLGMKIAHLGEQTLAALDHFLPAAWSHGNPVDILGDATANRYRDAMVACVDDANVDAVLVMLTPQAMTDPLAAAQAVVDARANTVKPVLACWLGETSVREARALFARAHIPSFPSPEASVEAFAYLANYYRNQKLLRQLPTPLAQHSQPDVDGARLIIEAVLAEQRRNLTMTESKALLSAFNIPVLPATETHSANEALVAAESIGFPVVMKISSADIVHKSDMGGVRLNIGNAAAVRSVYKELVDAAQEANPRANVRGVTVEAMYSGANGRELLLGVMRDPVFGPVISFGAGGTAVEILRDRAVALPPLNMVMARNMIAQTRMAKLLDAFRGKPAANVDAIARVLRQLSEMVCELPGIQELDINPLIADEHGVVAIDARVTVGYEPASGHPYQHMAIHPYPTGLVSTMQMPDGTNVVIRPIRPEDAGIEQSFVQRLSPQSKYFRFMQAVNELTPEMLVRFTQLDYHRELALIAVLEQAGKEIEIGVARYAVNPDGQSCEFALVVADEWHHMGIGSGLMNTLMAAAKARGLLLMSGEILAENSAMLELVRALGFVLHPHEVDAGIVVAEKSLQ
jgi:acetyltransferase